MSLPSHETSDERENLLDIACGARPVRRHCAGVVSRAGGHLRDALDVAWRCRTIVAANGISLEYPPLRHANSLESVLTYEGASEIHTVVIGQAFTGVPACR